MARTLTAGMVAELQQGTVRPVLFFEGEFADGFTRLWSGLGEIVWDGKTWTGAGGLLSISSIEETQDVRAAGVTVSISGIPAAYVSAALGQARQGLLGKVWLGFLNASGAVIADPVLAFGGRMDVPEVVEEGDTATISFAYESLFIDLDRARERRYTQEDQKLVLATDRGFEYVPAIQEMNLVWGRQ